MFYTTLYANKLPVNTRVEVSFLEGKEDLASSVIIEGLVPITVIFMIGTFISCIVAGLNQKALPAMVAFSALAGFTSLSTLFGLGYLFYLNDKITKIVKPHINQS